MSEAVIVGGNPKKQKETGRKIARKDDQVGELEALLDSGVFTEDEIERNREMVLDLQMFEVD